MIDHVTIGVADAEAARFYERVFALLGLEGHGDLEERFREWGDFSIAPTGDGRAVTTGLHVGFAARSREHVDEWWEELRGAGYASAGEPGPRPVYTPAYYGAFVLDPAGNSIEAVHDPPYRPAGAIDHVWVRVRSLERSAAFRAARDRLAAAERALAPELPAREPAARAS